MMKVLKAKEEQQIKAQEEQRDTKVTEDKKPAVSLSNSSAPLKKQGSKIPLNALSGGSGGMFSKVVA